MLIGIDIDDVLLHFTPALIEYHNHTYFRKMQPIVGAKEALFELRKKHNLVNITARPNYLETETREAINKYFPDSIQKIYLRDYYDFRKYSKRDICDSIGVDLMIEDSPYYALECLSPNRDVILFNRPWNIEVDLPKEIERINTWDEVLKIIK
ncbi:MAG: Had-superfamily hydrolase-like protein [archaeon GW2011_AR13]|nr:MAG: Had-superfamily hydrolase-like protein [archaeon GW2011_AR13]